MTDVIYREAGVNDIPGMVALLRALFSIEADFDFDDVKQSQGLELLLKTDRCYALVAEYEGKVIGMGTVQLTVSTAEGALSGTVEDMVVDDAWRGKGIGGEILKQLSLWSRSNGATRVQLLADKNNDPALKFYAAKGWYTTDLICLRENR